MGLLGPSTEAADDDRRGGILSRNIGSTPLQYSREETTSSDHDDSGASNNIVAGAHGRGVSPEGSLSKMRLPEYCDCIVRPGGLSLIRYDTSNRGGDDDVAWEYSPAGSSIANAKAAIRSGMVEKNLYRPQKVVPTAGAPTSIIVGFEAQASTSSHITRLKGFSDNAEASQVCI